MPACPPFPCPAAGSFRTGATTSASWLISANRHRLPGGACGSLPEKLKAQVAQSIQCTPFFEREEAEPRERRRLGQIRGRSGTSQIHAPPIVKTDQLETEDRSPSLCQALDTPEKGHSVLLLKTRVQGSERLFNASTITQQVSTEPVGKQICSAAQAPRATPATPPPLSTWQGQNPKQILRSSPHPPADGTQHLHRKFRLAR